jgi:hypothetical protein
MKSINELQTLQAQAFELAAELGQGGGEAYQIAFKLGQEIQQRRNMRRVLHHLTSDVETLFHSSIILRDFTVDQLNDFSVEFYEQLWQAGSRLGQIQVAADWRTEMQQYIRTH